VLRLLASPDAREQAGELNVTRIKHWLVLVVLFGGIVGVPAIAAAEDMTWTITSEYQYKAQLEFYSQSRDIAWPGGGSVYTLNDYNAHRFTIACRAGEKVCYGAWATGDSSTYWGVGMDNKHNCKTCCAICGESDPVKRLVQD
jgi:hypothetical protein